MSVGSADLHEAIKTVWDASTLNASFEALYDDDVDDSEFTPLNDQEAAPGQPNPYCVFQVLTGSTTSRMSSVNVGFNREIHDIPCEFRVHARQIDGDSRSSKKIAADLVAEIMKVFGGHPTVSPTDLSLDNGNFLISQYQNDLGIRTDEKNYQWTVTYLFRLDVPVAV